MQTTQVKVRRKFSHITIRNIVAVTFIISCGTLHTLVDNENSCEEASGYA